MAKLAAIVTALMASEATKPLGEELSKALGAHADIEVIELGTQFAVAATSAKQAAEQIATLSQQLKDAEPLKARITELEGTVQKYDGEKRGNIIAAAFAKAAKENGVQDNAVETALTLTDVSKLEVDLAKGEVKGLSKELFDGLKAKHVVLFTPPPAAAIPPAPANAGNANTGVTKYTAADAAAGRVQPEDILSGKAVIE